MNVLHGFKLKSEQRPGNKAKCGTNKEDCEGLVQGTVPMAAKARATGLESCRSGLSKSSSHLLLRENI